MEKPQKGHAWDNCDNWTTECVECGGTMEFHKHNFTYYCPECGNIFEI